MALKFKKTLVTKVLLGQVPQLTPYWLWPGHVSRVGMWDSQVKSGRLDTLQGFKGVRGHVLPEKN